MSPDDVPPYEMGKRNHDDELETFREELEAAFPARPVPAEDEHVAAMVAEAHLLTDKGDPVVRPASNAIAPTRVSWLPKQRRISMAERKWTHGVALKVLAPATIFFTMLGGVAWAGGLPQPLQKTASSVAGIAGLTIEDGTDDDTTEVETPDGTDEQGEDVTDPTSADNQDGDHQGEDNSGVPSTDNEDGDSQGEDPQDSSSGDDEQGEDTSGDTSTDSEDGDSQGEDPSEDSSSGDDDQGEDSSEDSSGSGSGSDDSSGGSDGDSQD